MRIGYWTTDVVNLNVAQELAEARGAHVEWLFCNDADHAGNCDAALYDLDFLAPEEKSRTLTHLTAGPGIQPTALHSYNLEDDISNALRRQGVAVYHRLDQDLIGQLCEAIRLGWLLTSAEKKAGADRAQTVFLPTRVTRSKWSWVFLPNDERPMTGTLARTRHAAR